MGTNESIHGERLRQNNDGQWPSDGIAMASNSTGNMEIDPERSNIRMYSKGLANQCNDYSDYSERERREAESERLIMIAKSLGHFRNINQLSSLGTKHPKRTGESRVYYDEGNSLVYKAKDPYAKSPLKPGVQPEDVIFEHLVHNKYFPETAYLFEGMSEELGDVRIILSQAFIASVSYPTKKQIEAALSDKCLYPIDNYSYGNSEITVTDIFGDNTLLGYDKKIYFIDPIINFKKTAKEILNIE